MCGSRGSKVSLSDMPPLPPVDGGTTGSSCSGLSSSPLSLIRFAMVKDIFLGFCCDNVLGGGDCGECGECGAGWVLLGMVPTGGGRSQGTESTENGIWHNGY